MGCRYDEFGVVDDSTGTGDKDLIAVIVTDSGNAQSTTFYDVTNHIVTAEFNSSYLIGCGGETLTLVIYEAEIGPQGDSPTGDPIASTTIVFTEGGN